MEEFGGKTSQFPGASTTQKIRVVKYGSTERSNSMNLENTSDEYHPLGLNDEPVNHKIENPSFRANETFGDTNPFR